MVRVSSLGKVAPWITSHAKDFVSWLRLVVPDRPEDRVYVYVVEGDKILTPDGVSSFGAFQWFADRSPTSTRVYVAAGIAEHFGLEVFLRVLSHEWEHYRQWHEGERPSERKAQSAERLVEAYV